LTTSIDGQPIETNNNTHYITQNEKLLVAKKDNKFTQDNLKGNGAE